MAIFEILLKLLRGFGSTAESAEIDLNISKFSEIMGNMYSPLLGKHIFYFV